MTRALLLKKKRVESGKPVSFKRIKPIGTPTTLAERPPARLTVTTEPARKTNQPATETHEPDLPRETTPLKTKLGALDKIRKQFKSPTANGAGGDSLVPLELDTLRTYWDRFANQLKDEKNSAAASFDMAVLRIRDAQCFDVVTTNNLQQKFLEKERVRVSEFLQKELNNRNLQFAILIEENPDDQPPIDTPMTAREQYQKMIEQYPLVKELKDRLRLELDY